MKQFRNWAALLPCLFLMAFLLSCACIGTALAKYVTQAELKGTVTISADLGSIAVLEHEAIRNPDGSYSLGDKTTAENTYYLLPGLDIFKDPFVRIAGKTETCEIGAYVYLVMDTNFTPSATGVSFTLLDCWKELDDHDNVYVYSDTNGDPITVTKDMDIYILKDNKVWVSQKLNTNIDGTLNLNFSAVMKQVIDGKTAKEIYEDTTNN